MASRRAIVDGSTTFVEEISSNSDALEVTGGGVVSSGSNNLLLSAGGSYVEVDSAKVLDAASIDRKASGTISVGVTNASLITINPGLRDLDTVIGGDTDASLFRVDASQDSIGVGVATPNASAKFTIASSTKGFVLPRMTTTQRNAIGSPQTSLRIFNISTNFHSYYNGVTWSELVDDRSTQTVMGQKTFGSMTNQVQVYIQSAPVQTAKTLAFRDQNGIVSLAMGATRSKTEWEYAAAPTVGPTDVPDNTSTTTTIKLAAGEPSQDDYYASYSVELTSGTGSPATRNITTYDGTTKIATISGTWPGSTPAGPGDTQYRLNLKRDMQFRARDAGTGSVEGAIKFTNDAGQVMFTCGQNEGCLIGTNLTFNAQGNAVLAGAAKTLGFYASAGTTKPTITGSRAGNAALADLLTDLASLGLITNSTTAGASAAYTVTNPSTDRAFDVASTTLNEIAAVLGTVIADLKTAGILT